MPGLTGHPSSPGPPASSASKRILSFVQACLFHMPGTYSLSQGNLRNLCNSKLRSLGEEGPRLMLLSSMRSAATIFYAFFFVRFVFFFVAAFFVVFFFTVFFVFFLVATFFVVVFFLAAFFVVAGLGAGLSVCLRSN